MTDLTLRQRELIVYIKSRGRIRRSAIPRAGFGYRTLDSLIRKHLVRVTVINGTKHYEVIEGGNAEI